MMIVIMIMLRLLLMVMLIPRLMLILMMMPSKRQFHEGSLLLDGFRRSQASGGFDLAETRVLLERYAALRPVDPFPHRVWAKLATGAGDLSAAGDEAAMRHLRELDLRADKDNIYALAIARNRREAGDLKAASEIGRAHV